MAHTYTPHTYTDVYACIPGTYPESIQQNGNTTSGQTDRKKVRGSSTVSPNQHGIKMKIDSGVVSAQSNHERKAVIRFHPQALDRATPGQTRRYHAEE